MGKEICCECGESVAKDSGNYINRVPEANGKETREEMGKPYPEGDYICNICDKATSFDRKGVSTKIVTYIDSDYCAAEGDDLDNNRPMIEVNLYRIKEESKDWDEIARKAVYSWVNVYLAVKYGKGRSLDNQLKRMKKLETDDFGTLVDKAKESLSEQEFIGQKDYTPFQEKVKEVSTREVKNLFTAVKI